MTVAYGRIYVITNSVNGKRYVGKTTKSLAKRWARHCKPGNRTAIANAIRKYNPSSFVICEVALATSRAMLDDQERRWIAALGTMSPHGYNLHVGGQGGAITDEAKAKIREAVKRQWREPNAAIRAAVGSVKFREKLSAGHKASWADPKRRASMLEARRLPEARSRASESQRRTWAQPEYRARMLLMLRSAEMRESLAARNTARWSDPTYRSQIAEARAKWRNDPAAQALWREAVKKGMESPECRALISQKATEREARKRESRSAPSSD